jgi:hypothetical protein
MLAWAMGSTNGHVTSALWMDGQLYVVESTVKDSYWYLLARPRAQRACVIGRWQADRRHSAHALSAVAQAGRSRQLHRTASLAALRVCLPASERRVRRRLCGRH